MDIINELRSIRLHRDEPGGGHKLRKTKKGGRGFALVLRSGMRHDEGKDIEALHRGCMGSNFMHTVVP